MPWAPTRSSPVHLTLNPSTASIVATTSCPHARLRPQWYRNDVSRIKIHVYSFCLVQIDATKNYSSHFFYTSELFYAYSTKFFIRTNLKNQNRALKISFRLEFNIANISLPVQRRSFLLHLTDTKLHLQHVQLSSTKLSTIP